MKTPLVLLSAFLGVVLTVHLAMNGMVGAAINNARVGNAVFWCIGALTAVIIRHDRLAERRAERPDNGQSDPLDGWRYVLPARLWHCGT